MLQKTKRTERFGVRIDDEEIAMIEKLAAANGTNASSIIRMAIREKFARSAKATTSRRSRA